MKSYPETYLQLDQLGKVIPAYQPTHDFPGEYIDEYHQEIANLPREGALVQVRFHPWFNKVVPGWLRREDALKIYEMAFYSKGDILELGSYHGLSTALMAKAIKNSGNLQQIETIDLAPQCVRRTRRNLILMGLNRNVTAIHANAVTQVIDYGQMGKKFGFAFIDHSHAYEPVYQVCLELRKVMVDGGFCLFHDYNDEKNRDEENVDYGVYQAVNEGLSSEEFEFYGIFGCTALYRAI